MVPAKEVVTSGLCKVYRILKIFSIKRKGGSDHMFHCSRKSQFMPVVPASEPGNECLLLLSENVVFGQWVLWSSQAYRQVLLEGVKNRDRDKDVIP